MGSDRIVKLGAKDAPSASDAHRLLVTFPDDHDINGMKVDVTDVTPEQVSVAIFHLQRVASQLADLRQFQAETARREVADVAAALRRNGK